MLPGSKQHPHVTPYFARILLIPSFNGSHSRILIIPLFPFMLALPAYILFLSLMLPALYIRYNAPMPLRPYAPNYERTLIPYS